MAHRIDIELTSQSGEGIWTWRAAGAKQPRGTVGAELVPPGSAVGAIVRAEIESTLDGTAVLALLPPKTKTERSAERIEVIGTPRSGPDVNVVLASKPKGRRSNDRADRSDRPRDGGRRPSDRRPGAEGGERGSRDGSSRRGEAGASSGPDRQRDRPSRPGQSGRAGATRDVSGRGEGHRRLQQSTTFRNAALATLKPEQLAVAEQLLRGGIPAVRQALDEQNERARADGRPEVTPGPLLALAEQLLPVVTLAAWKDRASAVRAAAGNEIPLRELRTVVAAASTVMLDEDGRELSAALRAALDQRVTALRERWVERITAALDAGRVVDALQTSIRPPEASTRLSAELAVRLSDAAGQAMSKETAPGEWMAILDVVVESPVRRTVKPAGIPGGADETLLAAARKASGYVPELARLLGIPIPPPPGPRRPVPARSRPSARRPA